jgi:hypothetical protein
VLGVDEWKIGFQDSLDILSLNANEFLELLGCWKEVGVD